MSLPLPLTPAGCDLRGLPYFPVDVARLRDSDLWQLSTPEQFKAAFALWCRSWLEVPAASLPDDEAWLARAAGVALDDWRRIAPMALRGWIKCVDGRLYHPVIAERACRAWLDRLVVREKSAKGNASRYGLAFDPLPWLAKRTAAADCLTAFAQGDLPQGALPSPTGSEEAPTGSHFASEGEEKSKGKRKDKGKSLVVPTSPREPDDVRQAFDLYNDAAESVGLTVARDLTSGRRTAIAARLKSGGLERWKSAMAALSNSAFLCGRGPRGWRADLDWISKPTNFAKVIEGSYDDGPGQTSPTGGGYLGYALRETRR